MKVFVSSTCFDLIDVRAEVSDTLSEMGFEPVLSDDLETAFNVLDTSVGMHNIEMCIANMKECQFVIFILSERYGTPLSKFGIDVSATHHEYNEAMTINMRHLFFVRDHTWADYRLWVKNKKKPRTKTQFVQAKKDFKLFEMIAQHEANRAQSKSGYRILFKDTRELKRQILSQLHKESMEATLDKMLLTGNVPLFVLTTNPKSLRIDRSVWNRGETEEPVILLSGYVTGNINPCFVKFDNSLNLEYSARVSDMLAYQAQVFLSGTSFTLAFFENKDAIWSREKSLTVEIRYTLPNGYRLMDQYYINTESHHDGPRITCEFLGKELLGVDEIALHRIKETSERSNA